MELVWATNDFRIAGRPYPGFPILLLDTMESFVPGNIFLRYYLLRGSIGSRKSWPSTARALYDYFSFLAANSLNWQNISSPNTKDMVAAYRDYCLIDCKLSRSTVRQRLIYVCKFYEYSRQQDWISDLPFQYEERSTNPGNGFFAHLSTGRIKISSYDVLPRTHKPTLKFLNIGDIKLLIKAAQNPHHRMIIRFALQTGLRREEIATFPLSYIINRPESPTSERNIRIHLDPNDGQGMQTKGGKPRHIYISKRFMIDLHRYAVQVRGERSGLSGPIHKSLFLNKFGAPYSNGGKGIERLVRNLGKKIGIVAHPHMLRHSYATHTLIGLRKTDSRIDPLVFIQNQLGHSSIQTTLVYLHLVNELADDAVLAYDDELNRDLGES